LSVPAFRVTPDDLVDADKKTKAALGPLLDALNRCLSNVIVALNSFAQPTPRAASFVTDEVGAAYVDVLPGVPMKELWVTALQPQTGVLSSVWSMSWIPQDQGARMLFVGLAPYTTYAVKARYL
jgi:hypothetical protein